MTFAEKMKSMTSNSATTTQVDAANLDMNEFVSLDQAITSKEQPKTFKAVQKTQQELDKEFEEKKIQAERERKLKE